MATMMEMIEQNMYRVTAPPKDIVDFLQSSGGVSHVFCTSDRCIYSVRYDNEIQEFIWLKCDPKQDLIPLLTFSRRDVSHLWDEKRQGMFPFELFPRFGRRDHQVG